MEVLKPWPVLSFVFHNSNTVPKCGCPFEPFDNILPIYFFLSFEGLTIDVDEFVLAPAGGQATISCNYTGDKTSSTDKNGLPSPALDVRWVRNGSSEILITKTANTIKGKWFDEGRATVVGQASLRIFAVSFRDAGKYTCKIGDAQGTTELRVDGKFFCFSTAIMTNRYYDALYI